MDRQEWRWAVWVSLAIIVVSSIPYIIGWGVAPAGCQFIGLTRNVDDGCVYLSWMRQAADGHFFLQNLFTTEPQTGSGFNLFFFALGTLARVLHLPLIAVFHITRVGLGLALLLVVYGFSSIWLGDKRARQIALLVVGLSSGVGWVCPAIQAAGQSVDFWQPEAVTFLSIYLSPLFSFSMLLMVGGLCLLNRFALTGMWKFAVGAGLLLMLLANVHTYDVMTVAIVWYLFCIYRLIRGPGDIRPIVGGIAAAVIAAPMAAYQLYFYLNEPVFRIRAAVPTLSPQVIWYLTGYGLLIPLAAYGIWRLVKERRDASLLVCWAAGGFIAAYLPAAFQRKLIMGTHIPLSLLAVMGLLGLVERFPIKWRKVMPLVAVALMVPSNLLFLGRDTGRVVSNEGHTTAHVPFVSKDELGALEYLRVNVGPDDVILAFPGFASLVPAYTGGRVYYGHWGETVGFGAKLSQVSDFFSSGMPDQERRIFLEERAVTYVVGYHWGPYGRWGFVDFRAEPPPYLEPVFSSEELTLYRVKQR